MTLTRDQILAKRSELPRESFDVPELGGTVTIRVLSLKEAGEFQRLQKTSPEVTKVYPKLVALSLINDDGSPVFVGEDIRLIEELPWPAVDAIAKEVLYFNKMADRPKVDGEEDGPKA
jgi:hypothetical protein